MAIVSPQTDLFLLQVPLEIGDDNQLTFANNIAQYNYFSSLTKLEFDNFTYQRKDNTIRIPANIEGILQYNYVMYRNTAFSNKWFYAFITDMQYLNDEVTAVTIKTDVWQTWQFDLKYKRTFVEREHVNSDIPGEHTVPEGIEYGDYVINQLSNIPMYEDQDPSPDWCVCFAVTEVPTPSTPPPAGSAFQGETNTLGGVFTSLHFFAVSNFGNARQVLTVYNETSGFTADAIKNVYLIPRSLVYEINNPSILSSSSVSGGVAIYPILDSNTLGPYYLIQSPVLAGGYEPVNKKLFAWPYSYFHISNQAGTDIPFRWEDFPITTIGTDTGRTVTYKKALVPTASVSAKLYFTSYKGYTEGTGYGSRLYSYGINFGKVPVCAWTTDYYTNWLTQNGVNLGVSVAKSAIGGAISGGIVGGAIGLLGSTVSALAQMHEASTVPDQAHGDENSSDIAFGYARSSMSFYAMTIRPEYSRIIDGYFSKFGYKVNEVKIPNITGRRNWNYVKTIGCYIDAEIPQSDLQEIKSMFDKGITLWHNPATFADYSQNNDII